MNNELIKVLDEIRGAESSKYIDPNLLWPYLQIKNFLSEDEVSKIKNAITKTAQLVQIFEFLKSKDVEVFIILQKFCHGYNVYLFKLIQTKLKEVEKVDLIWVPLFPFNVDPNLADKLESVQLCLKDHYEQDLELIRNYWKKFGVRGILTMDNFYNQNIIVRDKNELTTFKDFDQLFSTVCRRFIITADAGYGKSTFVHEMARQWVKGENSWTKKFSFLFLIRLSEVNEAKSKSLESFLTMCLSENDAGEVRQLMRTTEFMKSCLFIFDGFDEFNVQHGVKISGEIDDIIYGRGVKLAHVVITSRPCEKLDDLDNFTTCDNLYIELKGYTDDGAYKQLERFKINVQDVRNELGDILKVPLFNTLFCITHKEAFIGCLSVCTTIEKFVNFACKRHQKTEPNFTVIEGNEVVKMLGQAAQNRFSLLKDVNIGYPSVSTQQLSNAINIGLVSKKSTKEDFVFAHQTIAEYCAAYFWVQISHLKIKNISNHFIPNNFVYFAEPEGGRVKYSELFSCFLSHLNDEYKQFLWRNFEECVPLLDEYNSLPKRQLKKNIIVMLDVPFADRNTVMDKIDISISTEDDTLSLSNANFESGKKFENITRMKHLQLFWCSFKISPEEFFHSYNIQHLELSQCTFIAWNQVGEDRKEIWKKDFGLENLQVGYCDFTVVKFLSFIMSHCTTLKTFKLNYLFENETKSQKMVEMMEHGCNFNYFGEGWISELQNNEKLILSIEDFTLFDDVPFDLTILFETLGRMVNLKCLKLTIKVRNLTKAEINSLKLCFKDGLKELVVSKLYLTNESGEKINLELDAIMEKITLQTMTIDIPLWSTLSWFSCDNFQSGKKFENITKIKALHFLSCAFKITPEKFFRSYIIECLVLSHCTFNDWDPVGEDLKEIWKNDLILEYLDIKDCNFTVVKFLSFVMKHCTTLKTLVLRLSFEREMERQKRIKMESSCNFNYFEDWISELQNNEKLILSIETFEFDSADPINLTILFETLGRMVNLKYLELKVKRNLTKAEINSLKLSFENGLRKLEKLEFKLKAETLREINENKGQLILGSAVCDGCHQKREIVNVRFTCYVCPDYDLCENCQVRSLHDHHEMGKYISSIKNFWRKAS